MPYFGPTYAQNEILPLALDKLNRDSLNEVLSKREKENDYQALGDIYGSMFAYYFMSEYRDSAVIYVQKAEENLYKAGDSAKYYFTLHHLGSLSVFDVAESYDQKALGYFIRVKNYKMMAHAYNNLAFMYWQKYDTSQYLKYYYLAVEANKKGKDVLATIILNNSRAGFLMGENKLDSAIYLCRANMKLLDTAGSIGNGENYRTFWRAIVLNHLADCYMRQKKYLLAIQYLNEAAEMTNKLQIFQIITIHDTDYCRNVI
jgi:tetratricopeptide (TPR) repeat protein